MKEKILEIEFDSKNYEKIGYLFDGFCIMYRMDSGLYIEMIDTMLGKKDRTLDKLESIIQTINDDIQRMKEYMIMNGVNPNWLKEYKDISPQDFLHLVT